MDFLAHNWTAITVDRAFELAQAGVPVVGGASASSNGHVIVVYPGTRIRSGGYAAISKKTGKSFVMPLGDSYARAMSTSLGSWPGARSNGDKTVWDPWGSDDAFKAVGFWAPKELATFVPKVS